MNLKDITNLRFSSAKIVQKEYLFRRIDTLKWHGPSIPMRCVLKRKCSLGHFITAIWFCIFGTPICSGLYLVKLAPEYRALAFWHIPTSMVRESLVIGFWFQALVGDVFPESQCWITRNKTIITGNEWPENLVWKDAQGRRPWSSAVWSRNCLELGCI